MFSEVTIYVCGTQEDIINKRLEAFDKFNLTRIMGPGTKDGCVFVIRDIDCRGRDHGYLTQELFRGVSAYDYLMLMQHATDPLKNEVHGMAWNNPYGIDFVCERYIAVDGERVENYPDVLNTLPLKTAI